MEKKEIEEILNLRQKLILKFNRLKDYKSNKNAIMLEKEHAQVIHETVVTLDIILKNYVNFSDKK